MFLLLSMQVCSFEILLETTNAGLVTWKLRNIQSLTLDFDNGVLEIHI